MKDETIPIVNPQSNQANPLNLVIPVIKTNPSLKGNTPIITQNENEQEEYKGDKAESISDKMQKIDEHTLRNLKEKRENPFWMPVHNEEIFELRDIMRQERELKRAINRTKQSVSNNHQKNENKIPVNK